MDWLVIFGITGTNLCTRLKQQIPFNLEPRGHHDSPVMRAIQEPSGKEHSRARGDYVTSQRRVYFGP